MTANQTRPGRARFAVTIHGPLYWPDQYDRILEHARLIESLGIDYLNMPSHIVQGPEVSPPDTPLFQGWAALRALDPQPQHPAPDAPWLEPIATLSAIAGATTTLQIMSSILIAPLYPAPLLAKSVATIDRLSRGRFSLGVGASWGAGEYAALGVDFEDRGRVLDDTIAACRAIWDRDRGPGTVAFESETVSFGPVYVEPRPSREVPVIFAGAATARNRRRIVRWGHGWLPSLVKAQERQDFVARLHDDMLEAGRDPSELMIVDRLPPLRTDGSSIGWFEGADLRRSLDAVPALIEGGVNVIRVQAQNYVAHPDDMVEFLHDLAGYRSELGL